MKLIILLSMLFGLSSSPDGLPATVKEIRQAYADAHQRIAETTRPGVPRSDMETTFRYMVPAAGETTETIHAFYELSIDSEGEWAVHYHPYFIMRSYNISVLKFYEEYLYDADTGKLLFVYISGDTHEGKKNEERYYFGPDGLISEIIQGERTVSLEEILRKAEVLRSSSRPLLDDER